MKLTRHQVAMVAVLLSGTLLAVLNQTLLTPALPTIMDHLSVSATTAQWLTSGYSLVEAVIIPLNAYLLGRFPSKNLYVGGIGLFTAGSALCAAAPSFAFLMAGRICQAVATGVLMPTVFTQILLIFPRERRGSAMGLIGLILSFAPAVGPSISGVLVDNIGWRALFVTVAVIAAAIVALSAVVLRNFEGFERSRLDAPSIVLMAGGMFGLLWGLSTFSSSANLAVPVACIAADVVLVALFARRQTQLPTPILDVRVLGHRTFAVAVLLVALIEAVLIGSGVILPIFIQNALGQTATASGLLMLPGAACGAVCGLLAGKLFDRFGIRGVALGGAGLLVVGVGGYFTFHANVAPFTVGAFYTLACVGLQSLVTPVNAWGINALPNASVPHGNAIVSTMEQVGAAFGTAFVVSLTAFAPTDAAGLGEAAELLGLEAGRTFAGCHIAFAGLAALTVCIALVVAVGTRKRRGAGARGNAADEKTAGEKTAARTSGIGAGRGTVEQAADRTGTPGVDRPWLVADVMNDDPLYLGEHATVREAIDLMEHSETSGLPIVRTDGTVAGFISDGDILKRLAHHSTAREEGDAYRVLLESETVQDRLARILELEALELATRNVVCADAGDDAESAFSTLSARRIKKVPVVDGGVFVGTLSRRNIMRALGTMEGTVARLH